jgi:hypothetical protein
MELNGVEKIESNDDEFAVKYPSEDLQLGTPVVVNTSQISFFVKLKDYLDGSKKHFEI